MTSSVWLSENRRILLTTLAFQLTFLSTLGLVSDPDLAFVLVRFVSTDSCQWWMQVLLGLDSLYRLLAQSFCHL